MLNKSIVRAKALADKFRNARQWKGGSICARGVDAKGGATGAGNLYVYEAIGAGWDGGLTAQAVVDALDSLKGIKTLNVYINSEGGDVFEAKAIYAQLQRFPAEKNVYIDGIAASAASFIAMIGDKVVMAPEANVMIHNAWGIAAGDSNDLRQYADLLDMQNADIAAIYARKTGKSADEMLALMSAETWMTATKAVELGFANSIADGEPDDAQASAAAKTQMAAAVNVTAERLRANASEILAFRAANLKAKTTQIPDSQTHRASPEKGAKVGKPTNAQPTK